MVQFNEKCNVKTGAKDLVYRIPFLFRMFKM